MRAARTAEVLNPEGLSERLAQLAEQNPAYSVGAPAGWIRNDDLHRLCRPSALCICRLGDGCINGQRSSAQYRLSAREFVDLQIRSLARSGDEIPYCTVKALQRWVKVAMLRRVAALWPFPPKRGRQLRWQMKQAAKCRAFRRKI